MDTLDLHGIRHRHVKVKVEDFIIKSDMPCRIITGNSPTMKGIVEEVLNKFSLKAVVESDYNLGSLIVMESK